MKGFYYTSSSSHGVVTPTGKRVKSTSVTVENGRGKVKMTIEDNSGVHSDTRILSKKEVQNIKEHKFMPNLFHSSLTNIKNSSAKKNTKKVRPSKQGTRKQK